MFKKEGRVIEVCSDKVTVEFMRRGMCDCCHNYFCSIKDKGHYVTLDKTMDLKEGDIVEVGIKDNWILFFIFFVLFIPCIIFILSLYYFYHLGVIKSAFFSFLVVILYWVILKITLIRKWEKKKICSIIRRV